MDASNLDGNQAWLVNQLKETLNPIAENRRFVEDSMKTASSQPGYGIALSRIALNSSLDLGIRQLAAVLLKKFIEENWEEEKENTFKISPPDKSTIRQNLIQGIEVKEPRVFNAIAIAIAHVAIFDWPKDWPEIIHYLISSLSDQSNPSKTHASMKCLVYFSDEMDDKNVPQFAQTLFPVLFSIVTNSNFDPYLRQKSIYIFHSCIASLGVMSSTYVTETRNVISPTLPNWIKFFGYQLGLKIHLNDKNDIILKIEVLKSLIQIIQHFSSIAESEIPGILGALWQMFAYGNQLFHKLVTDENDLAENAPTKDHDNADGLKESGENGKENDVSNNDEDEGKGSFASLVIQEFEFLLSLITNRSFKKSVENSCEALIYFSIAYLQITNEEFTNWIENPNKFICDEEEEIISCRSSGILLIEELIEQFDERAINGLITAIEKRIGESYIGRDKEKKYWWKLREASLFALGNVSEQLIKANIFNEDSKKLDIHLFLKNLLENDVVHKGNNSPFLQFRAYWFIGRFSSLIPSAELNSFLTSSVNALSDDPSLIVKIGATKSLTKLFPYLDKGLVKSILPSVYNGLGNYLSNSSEESLHVGLELLELIIRADDETTLLIENSISSTVLKIFCSYYNDPLLGSDASDILEAIADSPGCVKPLVEKSVSIFANVITNEKDNTSLVAAVLELFTMLLNKCSLESVKFCFDNLFYHVIDILLQSDDNAELQNAADCLASFLRKGKDNILTWAESEEKILKLIFDSTARLLDPELDSSSSFRVGVLINQLILHFPSKIASHIFSLIHSIIQKMESSTMPSFIASLILVFARIIHMTSQNVEQFIEILFSLSVRDYDNALSFLLSQWIQHHGLFFESYQRKVSITALIILLEAKNAKLNNLVLKLKKNHLENKAPTLAGSTILSLLADVLLERQEVLEETDERENAMEGVHVEANIIDVNENESMDANDIFEQVDTIQSLLVQNLSDDELGDDPDSKDDPINTIDLDAYIKEFLNLFYTQDPAHFDFLCQGLSPQKLQVLKPAI